MENKLDEIFIGWGIICKYQIQDILFQHKNQLTYLVVLDRTIRKAYHRDEIPALMATHSDTLEGSLLNYLEKVPEGALMLLQMIEEA